MTVSSLCAWEGCVLSTYAAKNLFLKNREISMFWKNKNTVNFLEQEKKGQTLHV